MLDVVCVSVVTALFHALSPLSRYPDIKKEKFIAFLNEFFLLNLYPLFCTNIRCVLFSLSAIFTFVFLSHRKVTSESATGSSSSERVRTTLTLSVEGIEYDSPACELRVKGRNIQENPYVKMGAYHTIDLTINQKFTLAKKCWDSVALDRLGKPVHSVCEGIM